LISSSEKTVTAETVLDSFCFNPEPLTVIGSKFVLAIELSDAWDLVNRTTHTKKINFIVFIRLVQPSPQGL
jgi:hypothetical protein